MLWKEHWINENKADNEEEGEDPTDGLQAAWGKKEGLPHTKGSKGLETFLTSSKSEFNGTSSSDSRPNILLFMVIKFAFHSIVF